MLFGRRFRLVRSSCGEICRARISDSVLTANALQIAYQSRIRPSAVLFHSDQGTYYTSKKFAESAASCKGMTQSIRRRGNPLWAQLFVLHLGKAVLC